MKSCLLCPRGKRCRGYVLHELIMKLYDAMAERRPADEIVQRLTREDMETMAQYGASARATCWSKGFVLTVARKLADMAKEGKEGPALERGIERMIVMLDGVFTKLPKGISVDLSEMAVDVFNQACALLKEEGCRAAIPANVVGQACFKAGRR